MTKPKLKEHLYREMVNELRALSGAAYINGINEVHLNEIDFGRMRTDIGKIISKYIEAGE